MFLCMGGVNPRPKAVTVYILERQHCRSVNATATASIQQVSTKARSAPGPAARSILESPSGFPAWGREMNRLLGLNRFAHSLTVVLLFSIGAGAQQKAQSVPQQRRSYDLSREVSLQGTVVNFLQDAAAPPLGPHVVIQTASGQIDVHLGDARLLQAHQFNLAAGDLIRVIGENVPYGTSTQFFARIIQKGNQTLTLRSVRGFPLRPAAKAGKAEAGVL